MNETQGGVFPPCPAFRPPGNACGQADRIANVTVAERFGHCFECRSCRVLPQRGVVALLLADAKVLRHPVTALDGVPLGSGTAQTGAALG